MLNIEIPSEVLRPQERNKNRVRKDAPHEDTNHLTVIKPLLALLRFREREPLANSRLDSRTRRTNEIAKLVRRSDSECAD